MNTLHKIYVVPFRKRQDLFVYKKDSTRWKMEARDIHAAIGIAVSIFAVKV
jgi:hypothetical protein